MPKYRVLFAETLNFSPFSKIFHCYVRIGPGYLVILTAKCIIMDNKHLNRLKVVLAEKGLSNKWLAEQLGITQTTVSKWVTNTTQPSVETLMKIAQLLDVGLDDLVRYEQVPISIKESVNRVKAQ